MTQTRGGFEIAGGTVAGAAHVRAGLNDQDAFAWASAGDAFVAFVCDGCGSGRNSEVGARLGARLLTAATLKRVAAGAEPPGAALWEDVRHDVLGTIRTIVDAMGDSAAAITDHFLFTLVGIASSPAGFATVSIGDGVIAVNGETRRLGPFEGNEPPYLAYALLGRDLPIRVHHALFREEVRSALIGTDGVFDLADNGEALGPLSQFWTEDRYFKNSDAVRRKLVLANRRARGASAEWQAREPEGRPSDRARGLLPDDTTLIALRSAR